MSVSFNAAEYLVDRHVSTGGGARTAIRTLGRSIDYAQLQRMVASASEGLHALGVRREERVLLVLLDGAEFVASFLGAMRLGAVPVLVNPLLPGRDVALPARDSRARVAIVSCERAALVPDLVAGAAELEELVMTGPVDAPAPAGLRVHRWEELMTGPCDRPADATLEDSPGFWLCSSGSTGRPKLIVHRQVDLRHCVETYAREILGLTPDDRCLSVGPLFHAYGVCNSLAFPLAAGASAVLEPTRPPTPALIARLVAEEAPTVLFVVPTFCAVLLAADLPRDAFAPIRIAVSAGEPLPGDLFLRFRDRFGVEILDGLGSTEMMHIFISNRAGDARPGSSGRPVAGYRVRLLDDDGAEVTSPGAPGHLFASGESAALGYWCNAEATRRTFQGEWVRTGDMYARSDDGRYEYLGRSDDMIKVSGEWVSPAEVEAVLIERPDVLEAAVVGERDVDGLTRTVAYVVPAPGRAIDPDAIAGHCRARLAGYKRPRRLVVLDELPKTTTGKVQRFLLRRQAEAERPVPLAGKAALLTGALRGIGAAIARAFAGAGADVALAARSMPALEQVAAEVESLGPRAVAVACDVTRPEDVEACVRDVEAAFGRIDVLVNTRRRARLQRPCA
jgi:benzoate-CoA ligase family protein